MTLVATLTRLVCRSLEGPKGFKKKHKIGLEGPIKEKLKMSHLIQKNFPVP